MSGFRSSYGGHSIWKTAWGRSRGKVNVERMKTWEWTTLPLPLLLLSHTSDLFLALVLAHPATPFIDVLAGPETTSSEKIEAYPRLRRA